VGRAWQLGILKGLRDAGIDLTQADLIVGTSAGANLAAQLRSGKTIDDLYSQLVTPPSGLSPSPNPNCSQAGVDQAYFQETNRLYISAPDSTSALRSEVGQRALAATKVISEDAWILCIGAATPHEWPSQPLRLASVSVSDGTVRLFDSTQGVPIERALAASNAVPGLVAPITVGNQRYMDGAVFGANIEGAAGYPVVVAVTPIGIARAKQETESVRSKGVQVIDVAPDEESVAARGPNIFDASRQKPAAEAGLRQASTLAVDVRKLWNPAAAQP
jgi:NTE family protein